MLYVFQAATVQTVAWAVLVRHTRLLCSLAAQPLLIQSLAQNAGGAILTVTGDLSVTGLSISGDGSSITNLNGSNVSSGTVNDVFRPSANVTVQNWPPLMATANSFDTSLR